jgi:hypothetical protein
MKRHSKVALKVYDRLWEIGVPMPDPMTPEHADFLKDLVNRVAAGEVLVVWWSDATAFSSKSIVIYTVEQQ